MTADELGEAVAGLLKSQQETALQMRETDRKIGRLEGILHNQWGRLVEALVEPGCLALFQARGIAVEQSMRRVLSQRVTPPVEMDVLLVNGTDVVAVEVKSVCRVEDVDWHEEQLGRFRAAFPQYAGYRVLGAVAALEFAENCDRYAERRGFFVVKSRGAELEMANPPDFKPRVF